MYNSVGCPKASMLLALSIYCNYISFYPHVPCLNAILMKSLQNRNTSPCLYSRVISGFANHPKERILIIKL